MKINNFKKLIDSFDCFLLDQWGVLHNGIKKYRHIDKTLAYLKRKKKICILLSNTSQSSDENFNKTLKKLKIKKLFFKKNITSGEILLQIYKQFVKVRLHL